MVNYMIKEKKIYLITYTCLFILSIIINLLFIYNTILFKNIENISRIFIVIISLILTTFFNIFLYKTNNKKKFTSISIIFFLYIIILIIVNYNLKNIYNKISVITNNNKTYSSSIVTLISNDNEDIIKIDKIGLINEENSIEGYQIPIDIINNNNLNYNLIKYDDYVSMINDLLNKKIEYIFLPTDYLIKFKDIEFNDNLNKTKIIYSSDKNIEINKTKKELTNPFTILLMGVDSTDDNIKNSSYNGDALMVLTYNPNTYTTTILSIPRDSYVNISCMNNRKNKITHSAWYDEECIIDTINNTFNINIDYYVKINFKGLVNLVDNLGGIEVEVPYSFCESDSNRLWGSNTVYVKEGLQLLDGEQALALARNRHPWKEFCDSEWTNYYSSDIIRGQNQQLVLTELLNKIKDIKSISKLEEILDIIKDNTITNLTTNNILSFYNTSKDLDKIKFQKLYLNGYDKYIYDYDYISNKGTKLTLYNYVPYKNSIDLVSNAMKDNLDGNLIVGDTIGEVTGDEDIILIPNFTDKPYYEAEEFCNDHNIKFNINYITGNKEGIIKSQSIEPNTNLEYVDKIEITVYRKEDKEINNNENKQTEKKEEVPKNKEDNINNSNENINKDNSTNNITKENNTNQDTNNNTDELDPIINEIFN